MDTSLLLIGTGAAVAASGVAYRYLNDQKMQPALVEAEKILCDLHAHPTHRADLDVIIDSLSSPGLVGLAVKDIDKSGRDVLRYEQALDILPPTSFTELDNGRLAKCGEGYFARTQEIQVGKHHVLAVGWEGNTYFPNYGTIEEAVSEIHARKGIAILNHPFALVVGHNVRLPNSKEEEELIRKAYDCVDEVEVHNAYCIDLVPSVIAMKQANTKAEALRKEEFSYFTGTASSDCHRIWEQVKLVGIYIDQSVIENHGTDGIKGAIVNGKFQRFGDSRAGPYLSRWSFAKGLTGDMLSLLR